MRFTVEEAFEASECGEPIMISRAAALRIVNQHDCGEDFDASPLSVSDTLDAADLLRWLGY